MRMIVKSYEENEGLKPAAAVQCLSVAPNNDNSIATSDEFYIIRFHGKPDLKTCLFSLSAAIVMIACTSHVYTSCNSQHDWGWLKTRFNDFWSNRLTILTCCFIHELFISFLQHSTNVRKCQFTSISYVGAVIPAITCPIMTASRKLP